MLLYTAVFGSYDVLRPTKYPSICLTDGSVKPAKGWTIRVVSVPKSLTSQRASRYCKLFPWKFFRAKVSMYFDGNIYLKADPSKVALGWLKKHDITVFKHPERSDLYDEAVACIKYKKGDPDKIRAQVEWYREKGYPPDFGLAACGVLVRRHSREMKKFSDLWWEQLCTFSRRDQLSFNYVRWKTDLQYGIIPGDILKGKSKYFGRRKHK